MLGINYRYQLNEAKGTIKLAPTKRSMLGYTALIVVPMVVLGLIGFAAEKEQERLNEALNTDPQN